jgi:hypothetical protein
MSILNKLSSYSWDAKAVLTLAAFALEYGDFWVVAQLYPSDQLAKSLGNLKQVSALSRLSIAMDRIPVDVYWAIITVVACASKMCDLTSNV